MAMNAHAGEYDIPLDDMSRILRHSGQSLGASGLFVTALVWMMDSRKPLPADAKRAAKIVRLHIRSYARALEECLTDGSLVRLPSGDIWAPLVDKCRPSKAVRTPSIPRQAIPSARKDDVLAKTGGKCAYCAVVLTVDAGNPTSYEPDHVLPVALGGSDDVANLIPSCRRCNRAKRDKTALRFIDGGDA